LLNEATGKKEKWERDFEGKTPEGEKLLQKLPTIKPYLCRRKGERKRRFL